MAWPRAVSIVAVPLAIAAAAVGVTGLIAGVPPQVAVTSVAALVAGAPAVVLGLIISRRKPANPVGALLSLGGLIAEISFASEAYLAAAVLRPELLQVNGVWISLYQGSWMVLYLPWALLLLVFPDGRLRGRLGRYAAFALIATAIGFELLAVASPYADPFQDAQRGFPQVPGAELVGVALLPVFLAALIACVVSARRRYRSADIRTRVQLRWLAVAGLSIPATLLLCWIGYLALGNSDIVALGLVVIYLTMPLAIAIAILRADLYDVDRAVVSVAAYSILGLALAGIAAALAPLAGPTVGGTSTLIVIAATVATVLALTPVRRALERWLSRRLYPLRERALEAMADLQRRIYSGEGHPEELEGVLRESLQDPALRVGFAVPEVGHLVDGAGESIDSSVGAAPIRLGGRTIGALVPGPGRRDAPASKVLDAVALPAEMVRLRLELTFALREVDASRARLLRAGYEERQRLERDLHDGAQQRLVALGMSLRLAQRHLGSAAVDVSGVIDESVAELGTAVAELRQIAHGLRPSSLDDGLLAALTHLSSTSPLPVDLDLGDSRAAADRLSDAISTTAYFVASEAVANAVKHAKANRIALRVAQSNGSVSISVRDDGRGGASVQAGGGLAGLVDRVNALGGDVSVSSSPGNGTVVEAVLPCAS